MDQNPYLSPSAPPGPPADSPTGWPTSLTVLGILNVVYGVLCVCANVGSTPLLFIDARDPKFPNPMLELFASNENFRLFFIGTLVIGVILSAVILAGGIGLLLSRTWGRTLSIVYAWCTIAIAVVTAIVTWYAMKPLLPARFAAIGAMIGTLFGCVLQVTYPIVLLVFMNRRVVRDAVEAAQNR